MELGLGIHGEPGLTRTQLRPADELVELLLSEILQQGRFGHEKRVAVMVNNLGATTPMELAIVARQAVALLRKQAFTIERLYAGTFLSSLDMAGISISVLGIDEDMLRWLDAPTEAPAWPNLAKRRPENVDRQLAVGAPKNDIPAGGAARTERGVKTRRAIEVACADLIAAEPELTEMDRLTGDGDLGVNMKRAASAVRDATASYPLDDLSATLKMIGHTLRREFGRSSGPLYGVLFFAYGQCFREQWCFGNFRTSRVEEIHSILRRRACCPK